MGRFLRFEHVTFAYPGMPEQLLRDVFALFPEGTWTGVVGANGAGKTTLLKLAAGELTPSEGRVRTLGSARCVVQRMDAQPPDWDEFMNAWGPVAMDVRHRLGVSDDWYDRREALIHGERKRVQIAIALWRRPDVLALDEPTNHFDARTKQILFSALKGFHGAGLVGSHDRGFLDALCAQCLSVFPPSAVMRPGSVTAGEAEDRREQDHAKDEHAANSAKARRLKAVAQNRREAATTSVSQVSRPNALAADRTRRHG